MACTSPRVRVARQSRSRERAPKSRQATGLREPPRMWEGTGLVKADSRERKSFDEKERRPEICLGTHGGGGSGRAAPEAGWVQPARPDTSPPSLGRGRSGSGVIFFYFWRLRRRIGKKNPKNPRVTRSIIIFLPKRGGGRVWAGSSLLVGGIGSPFS